ncbi:MAG: bifunctional folylpolyglutamate synthase/dihydrofolate synthase [Bacteroidales bacterium]|nr:bifunctional folylpolyglutamate synthase/dihydrofolate synthase [Bacteroidales bacterium]
MESFDAALGHPWRKFKTIHVAGTNGKGSVSSMLAAALAATGLRVGLYTSPHLIDFRERIKIISSLGSESLSAETVSTLGHVRGRGPRTAWEGWSEAEVSAERDSLPNAEMIPKEAVFAFLTEQNLSGLSFFEITTGMAFWWYAEQEVDVAVIEVGLGGRLDSTNIITPELSVITSIGLDHCAMLGNTRAGIAGEKAGIFKPGVPAVVWGWDDETGPVFETQAAEAPCPLFFADEFESPDIDLDLTGPCQAINQRTVSAALELLGIEADREALAHTARITGFRGRWEKLRSEPETICDIGHNPPALKLNFEKLSALGRPLFIVYGVMADKDLDGIAPMMPAGAEYFLVAPANSRSLPVEALKERLSKLRPDLHTCAAPSVADGVRMAEKMAAGVPGSLVYIGGSTFVVSEAVELF